MTIELKPGVNLHILPTKKYKTIRIYCRFTARLEQSIMMKRALLSNLLETNSLNYPDQTLLSSRLAELYGASFGAGVSRKGNLHWLNLSLNLVNGKYINDPTILKEGVDFLKEVLFYPNLKGDHFDQATFDLEKENMRSYLESLKEDKQTLAALKLQETYFADPAQQSPSFGTLADLEQETSQSIAAYYEQMLANDQIDLFVVGDVEEREVENIFASVPFTAREALLPEMYYEQPVSNIVKEQQLQENVIQGKLNLAYATGVYYGDLDRFSLLVFNGLFGGFPHSKLFMNVREKESLAYYASSSFDTFRGYLQVQTGIESKNRNKVLRLIDQQLTALRRGEFTELAFNQTKAMLKNQYLLGLDSLQNLIETTYLQSVLPKTKRSDEEWLKLVDHVTREDVQKVARQIQLQAIFFLDGGQANG